jgi:hypothetical protein
MESFLARLRDIELNENSSRWNGENQGIKVNDEIELPTSTSLEAAPSSIEIQSFDSLPADVFVNHILPFVGNSQYRFVAGVCKTFQTAYTSLYQKKTSYCYVSSKEQAQICLNESPMSKRRNLCELAALHGNLVVLKYLRSMGCSWDWRTCANAAENGHLDVLIWARANHCQWGWSTCANAAKNGHLDVLKWARKKGCLWNNQTRVLAAKNGHEDVLQWAIANGCTAEKLGRNFYGNCYDSDDYDSDLYDRDDCDDCDDSHYFRYDSDDNYENFYWNDLKSFEWFLV